MTPIKNLTDKTESTYANAKALGTSPEQLKRWLSSGAYVKPNGDVYIKTKGRIKMGEGL